MNGMISQMHFSLFLMHSRIFNLVGYARALKISISLANNINIFEYLNIKIL